MAPPPPSTPPLLAGRYELLGEAGRGAMGVVYRAFDRESGRMIALKALHGADPDDLYRLKSEFRALAGLAHPNLVRLYEMAVDGDHGFFTMELVEGAHSLTDYVRNRDASEDVLRAAFRQLATALAALHSAGWIHRDLKPSNVLVDTKGRVVLLDLGLVRGLGAELAERTQVGAVVGTVAYMSPEQALGRPLSAASDWYSFGVLFYECLTGRSPFAGAPAVALLDRARFSIPPAAQVAPGCAADLADLANRLLANDPVKRPDARAVLAALGAGEAPALRSPGARRAPFVGRARELAGLGQAWAAVRGGATAVATIEGPSGLGKTALVERFIVDLPAQGALVLRARCYPHELVPFEALDEVVDDLSRYLSSLPPERLDAVLPRDTTSLVRVFPVLGRLPVPPARTDDADAEPHELRRRGFAALRELLARLADRRPVAIWIDDLQWADADSAPLLRELLHPPEPPRILWLLSFRAEDRERSPLLRILHDVLAALPREQRHAFALEPFAPGESEDLAALLADRPLPREAVAALARESRGSPFLLGELLASRDAATLVAEEVGLDDMVRRRLQTLPAEAQRLLAMLSVAAAPLDRGVVLEAAGLAPDPDLALALESRRLLRPVASETRGRLEIYHDRIREAIDRGLTAQARKACHADIASALERHGIRDPALLFTHHAGAGHRASAARYAFEAGEQAERQLAFDAAARFYRAALDQDRSALDLGRTLSRLAEALANAGHGPQAAAAFEGASAETTGEEALVLLQRAAEQYLVCGRREEGKRLLVPLLASQGVRFPATSPGAIAATLWRLPLLALRYLLPGARTQSALGTRADACARAARGLLFIDPPRAAYFAVATLTDALRGGDPRRIGQALCLVGGALAPLGGPALAWARAMLARADRIAAEVKDPHLDAMSIISGGQLDFIEGRFESMLERCDRGARLLAERCRGVRWDCDVAQMGALRALEELGRVEELRRRLPRLLEEAAAYDDLYAEVTFRLYDAFWSISRGEVQRAREQARDVLERWGREAFEMQHLYELRIQAFCDVYGGAPEAAWARLRAAWPRLERSGLLAHRMLCSDAFQLRARLALAAGQRVEREVERAARRLERMGRPDALGASCLLRAASADHAGDSARSLALLSKAETFYANASMALHVAYAQRRRGELLAGDEGDALIWRADRTLAAAGIEDPQRWLELQAPGFRSVRA